ncbi:MAG: FeS assembly SUF system protein [Legionellales bacterium]|nr:FeS assembly SUF system protein [Legionellales bacterium]|tara:strand:+ start:32488 stop:32832 length:345 start_codon:yes stop_codon:yes gene_type:complete
MSHNLLTSNLNDNALEQAVIDALKLVYDPEIPVNIYDLGLIYNLKIDAETDVLHIDMTLTAPGCPVAQEFPEMVADTVRFNVAEIKDVTVEVVWDPPWTMERMTEEAKLQLNMF